jgi:tetratricopeptide (TPR) repeat protein
MALIAGDHERAIQDLLAAEARLAPVPFSPAVHNESIALWFDLGTAFMAGGRPKDAVPRFRRIVDAGMPRLWNPIEFVRSLYALGQSYEQLGDRPKALEFYRRFLEYWGDGDIDRERVAEARKKLAGS